jgi:hypothetical protein
MPGRASVEGGIDARHRRAASTCGIDATVAMT